MKSLSEQDIVYQVVRSQRTTVDIIVERDGSILVRAPQATDDEQVASIVKSKHYWIYRKLAEWRYLNDRRIVREYKNGEGFLYLGRNYRLRLTDDQQEPLLLKNGRFLLRRDLITGKDSAAAKAAFRDFYIARGRERLPKRIAYYAPKIGVDPKGWEVGELGYRWASCSPAGKLAFHWKCMLAPQTIIDYIVVHELCHFHQRDHTEAFWNEIDKVLPDFHERKEWLRKYGAGLDM